MNDSRKNKIIIFLIFLCVIMLYIIIFIFINKYKKSKTWENQYYNIDKNEIQYNDDISIEEIKENTGITGENELYQIDTEYDGRKVLNIKSSIKFEVAFLGIIKQSKPELEELDRVFDENYPNKNGIWISKQSRGRFIELIKESMNSEYEVDGEGFLTIKDDSNQSENDKKLKAIINSNKKIIIDINDFDYEVDVVTGEVVEYPFEQLGDIIDIIQNDNEKIIVITKNEKNNFSSREIIDIFLSNA